jgi:hypothetical protein
LIRSDSPRTVVFVRSRHRFRTLASLSRRMQEPHLRLVPGCSLLVVDLDDPEEGGRLVYLRAHAPSSGRLAA